MPNGKKADADREIVLSLISHTNVGKTALARTLLRRDIGEVADHAHVTEVPEDYLLIEHDGCRARLWDTPGFGSNLAKKLARRLRAGDNPIGWILHQVWDRHTDRSLWGSQKAIRTVQSESDVTLYLVDAMQSPETVGYVDLEIEILEWIGKPVIVLLNQTGHPDPERERANEEEWRAHLSQYEIVKHVDTLDAFTRCWTEEHHILEKAAEVLPADKRRVAKTLRDAWVANNLAIFDRAVAAMARWAVDAVTDTEPLPEDGLGDRLWRLLSRSSRDRELDRVQQAMYDRLACATTETVNRLIAIHGLDGETAAKMAEASRDEFTVKRDVEEPLAATVGGAASGLVGGLSADLLAGGMTFGGGAIVGMLLGGATTYAPRQGIQPDPDGREPGAMDRGPLREPGEIHPHALPGGIPLRPRARRVAGSGQQSRSLGIGGGPRTGIHRRGLVRPVETGRSRDQPDKLEKTPEPAAPREPRLRPHDPLPRQRRDLRQTVMLEPRPPTTGDTPQTARTWSAETPRSSNTARIVSSIRFARARRARGDADRHLALRGEHLGIAAHFFLPFQVIVHDLLQRDEALGAADEEGGQLFFADFDQVGGVRGIVASDDEEQIHSGFEHLEEGVLALLGCPANGVEEGEILGGAAVAARQWLWRGGSGFPGSRS